MRNKNTTDLKTFIAVGIKVIKIVSVSTNTFEYLEDNYYDNSSKIYVYLYRFSDDSNITFW